VRMRDEFPAHLTLKGAGALSPWRRFMTGKVYEVPIPVNAYVRPGRLNKGDATPVHKSIIGTIRQVAMMYAKDTWPKQPKRVHIHHMYDEQAGKLYFQVIFKDATGKFLAQGLKKRGLPVPEDLQNG